MSEWKEYRLGDLGTVITGKTPSAICCLLLHLITVIIENMQQIANESCQKLAWTD